MKAAILFSILSKGFLLLAAPPFAEFLGQFPKADSVRMEAGLEAAAMAEQLGNYTSRKVDAEAFSSLLNPEAALDKRFGVFAAPKMALTGGQVVHPLARVETETGLHICLIAYAQSAAEVQPTDVMGYIYSAEGVLLAAVRVKQAGESASLGFRLTRKGLVVNQITERPCTAPAGQPSPCLLVNQLPGTGGRMDACKGARVRLVTRHAVTFAKSAPNGLDYQQRLGSLSGLYQDLKTKEELVLEEYSGGNCDVRIGYRINNTKVQWIQPYIHSRNVERLTAEVQYVNSPLKYLLTLDPSGRFLTSVSRTGKPQRYDRID
jgi:hypothetical protein